MKNVATAPAMEIRNLVPEAAAFVYTLYKEKHSPDLTYHSYQHAVAVADAVRKSADKVNDDKLALATLAAWFHDTGYLEHYEQPAESSIRIATEYLNEQHVPEDQIQMVAGLIQFVHSGREPETVEERLLHDANLVHAGKKDFLERSTALRMEWEHKLGSTCTDAEWAERQLQFLTGIQFTTAFGRKKYEDRRIKNLRKVHQSLAHTLDADRLPERPKEAKAVPSRGIETMYRSVYRTHISLSSIADSKANIMISINAILLSIIISFVSTRLQTDPWLIIPSASLMITSLIAIVFAIISARPQVTNKSFSISDVRHNKSNILFFGNYTNMPLEEFNLGMRELMMDSDMLYDNMISDIYSLGHVLQRKYRLLWISYSVFMAGLILSVVLFAVFFYLA